MTNLIYPNYKRDKLMQYLHGIILITHQRDFGPEFLVSFLRKMPAGSQILGSVSGYQLLDVTC